MLKADGLILAVFAVHLVFDGQGSSPDFHRDDAEPIVSGTKRTSPSKSRIPMVGLWPKAALIPLAKAFTVKRLAVESTTKRSRLDTGPLA